MPEPSSHQIFLSYSSEDKPWVSEFASALRDAGVKGWFDAFDLEPGEPWREKIEEALRESDTLVLILSPHSVESPWTFFELGAAVADRKRIIPVMAEGTDVTRVPPGLQRLQILNEPSPREAGRRVAEVLSKEKGQPRSSANA